MKTEVAIIGAGPAGLLLGHLLRAEGIECLIVERQSRAHVEGRIRAGVLETITTNLLHRLGLDVGLNAHGMMEEGFNLADSGRMIRIPITELTGQHVVVYGQTEVTRDLMDAAPERGLEIIFEAADVALHDIDGSPYVTYRKDGVEHRIDADFIAGCDGFHGPSRKAIPADRVVQYEREYPFGWLGILADVPPCHPELIYANTEAGFALASMRSPTRSRYYIQVSRDERLEDWPEERLWDELERRFAPLASRPVVRGPALEMSIAPLRPMCSSRCAMGGCSWQAMPRTSYRRPAPRASTSPRPTSPISRTPSSAGTKRAMRRRSPIMPPRRWHACGKPSGSAGR